MSPELTLIYMNWQYWITTANGHANVLHQNEGYWVTYNDALARANAIMYKFEERLKREKQFKAIGVTI